MTVKELKMILKDVPDSTIILLPIPDHNHRPARRCDIVDMEQTEGGHYFELYENISLEEGSIKIKAVIVT